MRKTMLFLALSLAALAASLPAPQAEAGGTRSCPRCITYSDGSQCCVSCTCDAKTGIPIACTENFCPPEGGTN
jgi:hypothetical protein